MIYNESESEDSSINTKESFWEKGKLSNEFSEVQQVEQNERSAHKEMDQRTRYCMYGQVSTDARINEQILGMVQKINEQPGKLITNRTKNSGPNKQDNTEEHDSDYS